MAGNDTFVENLDAVKSSVRLVAEHINRIKEKFPSLPQLEKQLSAIDYTQLNACLAFSIASIYFASLRVRGVDHLDHPIVQELERVKLYMKKIIQIRKEALETGTTCDEDLRPKIDAEVAERIVRFYTAGNQASDERAKRRKVLRSADNSEETQDEVEIEQEEEIEIEQEEEIDEEEEEEGELLLPQIELDSPKSIKEVAKSLKDVARLSKTKNRSAALAKNAMASSSSALRGKSSAFVSPTSHLSARASALIARSLSSSARATSSKAPSLKASSLSGCKKAVEIDLVSSASDKTDHGEVEKGSRRKDKQKRVEEKTVKTPETGKQRKQISDVGKRRLEDIIKGVAGRRDLSSREIEIDSSPKDLRNAKRKRQENKDEPTQIEEDSDAGNKAMHRKAKKAKKQQQSKVAPSAESSAVQRSFERPTSLAVSPSRSPNSSMIEVQKKKKNKKIEKKKISKRLAESTATKKISSKVRR